jgi:sn-glycerol 3-phosphate transport system permease protein
MARALPHAILIAAVLVLAFPLYYAFVISTQSLAQVSSLPPKLYPSTSVFDNYAEAWQRAKMGRMLFNSAVMAVAIAVGKIVISLLSAFAIVYFNFRGKQLVFWMIFITLMLPVEVRILPTYQVIVDLGLIDTYTGLTLPLMASATATFLFRQFFLTIPDELVEAARIDGAGPMRFFRDILLPLSYTNIAALFVILFIYGWTQYLWPLLITNDNNMNTIIIGLRKMISFVDADTQWNLIMAITILAMLPPIAVVVFMQRWFVKGLVETEK